VRVLKLSRDYGAMIALMGLVIAFAPGWLVWVMVAFTAVNALFLWPRSPPPRARACARPLAANSRTRSAAHVSVDWCESSRAGEVPLAAVAGSDGGAAPGSRWSGWLRPR